MSRATRLRYCLIVAVTVAITTAFIWSALDIIAVLIENPEIHDEELPQSVHCCHESEVHNDEVPLLPPRNRV